MNGTVIFILYLLIVNAIGIIVMGIDKNKAVRKKWRIPEKTLFFIAIIGGSLGIRIGMELFRHKTKHKSFTIGIPFLFLAQIICIVLLIQLFFS